jgi:dihydropteroate synthase
VVATVSIESPTAKKPTIEALQAIDDQFSQRFIELDPAGYFIIYVDRNAGLICAEHYTNNINDQGLAVDPETGEPFPCNQSLKRVPTTIYQGRTAKELGIKITEEADPKPVSCLDHALYLGREFVRAEMALLSGQDYIQD